MSQNVSFPLRYLSPMTYADFCGWTPIFVACTPETCESLNVAAVIGQDTQGAVTPMRGGASELSGRVGCEARLFRCSQAKKVGIPRWKNK